MIQETIAPKEIDAVKTLVSFATQRPGLSFEDYGSGYWYRKDQREVVKDLHDFWELMGLAGTYVENLNDKLRITLMNSSGRLTMNEQGVILYRAVLPNRIQTCCMPNPQQDYMDSLL